MNIRTLRTVLLIQSIEESDRSGEVLPLADRADATRAMARNSAPSADNEALLVTRAETLLAHVRTRSPAVDHVLAVAGGLSWLGRGVLVAAFIAGLSMSALDGSRRINILSFPLFGLVAWNLLVYAVLLFVHFRPRSPRRMPAFGWGHFYERWISRHIDSLLKQSTRFNAPLSVGLRRFSAQWAQIIHPLLLERATRLMHFAAALLAVGLIAGLYIRGIALRYEAGWESTFLGSRAVHVLLSVLYGPAAAISGLGLPSTDALNALRWTGVAGGGDAAPWIHLIALTATFYIVVPRLILASVSSLKLWRLWRRPSLPPSLRGYVRTLQVSTAGGMARETASVTPFAYEPSPESVAGLETLLSATLGGTIRTELGAAIHYGEEDEGVRKWGTGQTSSANWNVLLMALASTPEAENHGRMIGGLRDSLARDPSAAPLLIVIDAGPYAARMQGDASFSQRLHDRRHLWSEFVAGYGLRACVTDLTQIVAGSAAQLQASEALRTALWSSSGRE